MIQDIEFRFEQKGLKEYMMVAYMESVFMAYNIDELADPYCLSNLLVFSKALNEEVEHTPTGEIYKNLWYPFAPTWIAYEKEKQFTWQCTSLTADSDEIDLIVKSGLPKQPYPEVKLHLKVSQSSLIRAIQLGLGHITQ